LAVRDTGAAGGVALAIDDLSKVFPSGRFAAGPARPPVLSRVTLAVRFGEIVGLMGPNGAGKTTLLEIAARLVEPTTGTIDVRRPGGDGRERGLLGYSGAAGHGFYARMSARWNLEFFAVLDNLSRGEARRRAAEWLDVVGLGPAASVRGETFSDGMRQRLGLARALIGEPSVLLLDEPTRSVDPAFRQTLHTVLRRWCDDRRAILMVTHSLDEAEALCDRVCVLEQGRLVWVGPARGARQAAGATG
jgi:ABC-2 type transport system ATP-binding protein